jgi:hypothetical protein
VLLLLQEPLAVDEGVESVDEEDAERVAEDQRRGRGRGPGRCSQRFKVRSK